MRRVHLKGRENILKRLLVHAGGFNLALVLRKLVGVGKPRRLQGLQGAFACIFACLRLLFLKAWSLDRTGVRFNIAKWETAVTF
jgi:transposase